jgi:hypothetical protein
VPELAAPQRAGDSGGNGGREGRQSARKLGIRPSRTVPADRERGEFKRTSPATRAREGGLKVLSAEIRGVLDSIRFEQVVATVTAPAAATTPITAPVDPEVLRSIFQKVGCGSPGNELVYYARERDRGVSKAEVKPSSLIGIGNTPLDDGEIQIYHAALVEDAYAGSGLQAEDFRHYGSARCRASLERRTLGPIAVYQQKLEACVAKKKDRFACSSNLWKW